MGILERHTIGQVIIIIEENQVVTTIIVTIVTVIVMVIIVIIGIDNPRVRTYPRTHIILMPMFQETKKGESMHFPLAIE